MTHYDKMAAIAHRKFNLLVKDVPDYMPGRKVLAAFIIKRGEHWLTKDHFHFFSLISVNLFFHVIYFLFKRPEGLLQRKL